MRQAREDKGPPNQHIIAVLSLLTGMLLVAGCEQKSASMEDQSEAAQPVSSPTTTPLPAVKGLVPLGRSELLAAAAAAADEVAAGNPLPKANLELANRTFEIRLPFGCSDGVTGNWGQWAIDPETRVLRVTIRPELWGDNQTFRAMAGGAPYDAAQGFWIERPWTRSEQCPPASFPAPALIPTPAAKDLPTAVATSIPVQTLGLIQYFSPDAPRTLRRGSRPYAYTAKVPEEQAEKPRNFRVKLVGRIAGFADGQPVHCVVESPLSPPTCAASVEFTQVVLEDADTGESLTEWSN